DDGVPHRAHRSGGSGFADALRTDRVAGGRGDRVVGAERGQVGRRRHRVVQQGRGQRVAAVVVAHLLEQDLRDPLREATVHLPGREKRVDDGAAVVDGDEVPDRDLAGLAVDLDDGDVT